MSSIRDHVREFLHSIYQNPINRYLFEQEIVAKSRLPLTSVHELAGNVGVFSPFTKELYRQNDYYGHASILKRYLDIPKDYQFKFAIDHGIVFSENTNQVGTNPSIPSAVTFGKYQQSILKVYKPNVYCIGPYIHYAKGLLSDEQVYKTKRKLGTTLLVFPSHSTPSDTVAYDYKALINKVKTAGKDFQTIRICVYWSDVLRGMDKIFSEAGLECVTAGHVYDPNFLPRLKSIISLSDYAIGNGVGSNVGYCIYMNKPYQIIWQEQKLSGNNKAVKIVEDETSSKGFREVIKTLKKFSNKITAEQRKIIGYYWGFEKIQSPSGLKEIVRNAEIIYQKFNN
jgi:hypothetical protein